MPQSSQSLAITGTLLVVEDDPEVRSLLTDALLSPGHAVRTAGSAEAALGILEQTPPDLVLTDVHVGAMSGVELCAAIKADPRWACDERRQVNRHSGVGADLVRGLRTLDDVRAIIRYHHERWDGSGYPDGLRGESIPLGTRIMAVVDVYDAVRTAGPYKPPLSLPKTLDVLAAETDRGARDPRVVTAFREVLRVRPELGADGGPSGSEPSA
ncbi:MAG TPA: HD domain-containing phosphohydrolase [Methylomirabilota bacterium]|jgi:response regulator RpfG family c-di-GMP phosphodiesterase|nr:HD domain-containing phosphohydrolase [Methylomirabilota bacterium]